MSKPQIITHNGKAAFAVLPIGDYERLQAQAEELSDIQAFDTAVTSPGESFPDWVAQRLIDGEHPARVFRACRGLSLAELAHQTGLRTSYLSKIECGSGGSMRAFQAIAQALDVTVDDLID